MYSRLVSTEVLSGRRGRKPRPTPTPARAEKRTASSSTSSSPGVYLKSTDNRPDDNCWWCDPENKRGTHQTRDHLFKHCYIWNDKQAAMWATVKEATNEGQAEVADERCSPAVLDFLRSTRVGGTAPPVEENWDSEDEAEETGADEVADKVEKQAE